MVANRGSMMSSDDEERGNADTQFTFAVRELRNSKQGEWRALRTKHAPTAVGSDELTAVDEDRGFDPYNSTGTFDRNRAWARIDKG